jgi:hypothetical protein
MAITITNDAVSTRTNLGLGDAATKTVGTGAGNVPLNSNLSTVAASGAYADVSGTPTLSTVATSGAYADVSGTPTFKTVGGTSIEGSGNIESLPIGGSPGQVVTNTSSGVGTWADAAGGGKVLGSARVLYTGMTSISAVSASLVALNFQYPANSNFYMEISYTKLSATSDLIVMGHAYYKTTTNTHSFGVWDTINGATVKLMGMDEHNGSRGYLGSSFNTVFPGLSAGAKTFRASPGFHGTRSTSGYRNPNMYNHGMTDTPNNDGNSSYIMILEVEV